MEKKYNLEVSKSEFWEIINGLDKIYQHMDDIEDLDPEVHGDLIESNIMVNNLLQRFWFLYSGRRTGYGKYEGD